MAATSDDALAGVNPQPHPNANPLFQQKFRSIPRSEIPPKIGNMDITEELLQEYKGHEVLLKQRAKHPPHCYKAYDALRLCFLQRIDPTTCAKVVEAYRPCGKELHKAKLARIMVQEEERRKSLAAQAKVLAEQAEKAAGAAAGGQGKA